MSKHVVPVERIPRDRGFINWTDRHNHDRVHIIYGDKLAVVDREEMWKRDDTWAILRKWMEEEAELLQRRVLRLPGGGYTSELVESR